MGWGQTITNKWIESAGGLPVRGDLLSRLRSCIARAIWIPIMFAATHGERVNHPPSRL